MNENYLNKGNISDKAVPNVAMTTTAASSRRLLLFVVLLAVSLSFVAIFSIIQLVSKYRTPAGTINTLLAAVKAGNVEMLLADTELNFRERALKEIEWRGLEEYNKVVQAFEECIEKGTERYWALHRKVNDKGEEAFRNLPSADQRFIRTLSKNEWVFRKGMETVGASALMGESDPGVFIHTPKSALLILKLGRAALEAEGVQGIPDPASLVGAKYPEGAPPPDSMHARMIEKGTPLFDKLKKDVESAGLKAFSLLPRSERESIERKSKMDFVLREGIRLLPMEERVLITGPEMLAAGAIDKAGAMLLGMPLLPETQRRLIEGKSYDDFVKFVAEKDAYVRTTGRKKYHEFLVGLFGRCDHDIKKTRLIGKDNLDIIRVSRASVEIAWKGCTDVKGYLPSNFTLQPVKGEWQIVW